MAGLLRKAATQQEWLSSMSQVAWKERGLGERGTALVPGTAVCNALWLSASASLKGW